MTVKPVFLSSSMLPRKSMSSFSSYNFFICTVEMNEGFICIYQHSICFITCAILKASVFAILTKARKQTYGCTKVRSEAGITTSHIWLSEVSLEFWISSKMAVRLGVRPGVRFLLWNCFQCGKRYCCRWKKRNQTRNVRNLFQTAIHLVSIGLMES